MAQNQCQAQGNQAGSANFVSQGQVQANSRQLTDENGRPTFSGNNRQLTDPNTGAPTFTGYTFKLTDPQTGQSTFKGWGQNPLMKNRESAPDFHWNSNVNSDGSSQYSGFGRDPLTTAEGRSKFVGNNRQLTDANGRPTFVGNNRNLSTELGRNDFKVNYRAFDRGESSGNSENASAQPRQDEMQFPPADESGVPQNTQDRPLLPDATENHQESGF